MSQLENSKKNFIHKMNQSEDKISRFKDQKDLNKISKGYEDEQANNKGQKQKRGDHNIFKSLNYSERSPMSLL